MAEVIGHRLTESMVLKRAQKEHLDQVKRVNLWGLRICDVSLLFQIPSLEVISLSSNNISHLEAFSACENLKELYLRNNSIFDLNEVRHLSSLTFLHTLFLLGNPCCYPPNVEKIDPSTEPADYYRSTVIRHVPSLVRLDLQLVTEAERLSARNTDPTLRGSVGDHVNGENDTFGQKQTEVGSRNMVSVEEVACPLQQDQQSDQLACLASPNQTVKNDSKGENLTKSLNDNHGEEPEETGETAMPVTSEERNPTETVASIRQTISGLSLTNKQALAEILHILPRLNNDALSLLANEIETRRRYLAEMAMNTCSASLPSSNSSTC